MEKMLLAGAALPETGRKGLPESEGVPALQEPQEEGQPVVAGSPRFAVHARERLRIMVVDSRSSQSVGLYGEAVNPGRTVLHRIEADASASLTDHLRVGGLLRISNEDERVLQTGPAYYGTQWGSAFAEVSARRFNFRLGYYSIYMTPLTLQRWDWEDNPRIGGDAGCGCGPAVGAILFESLEEFEEELTFEGALATLSGAGVELRAFYAIPRRPIRTDYLVYRSTGADRARYSLELGGIEARWRRFDRRTGSFWRLEARALMSFENRRSVDFNALHYAAADPWTRMGLAGVSAEIPVLRSIHIRGEIVPWNRTVTEAWDASATSITSTDTRGTAGTGGIVFEAAPRHLFKVDYVRLDPEYIAPYAALSYDPNMEGIRLSARESLVPERLALSLFYRRLREIDTADEYEAAGRKRISFAGVSIDASGESGWGCGAGWLEKHDWRDGPYSSGGPSISFDSRRQAIAAYLSRVFAKYGIVQVQYQRVGTGSSLAKDPYADIWSIDVTVRF
jgi:hypothetical protein